jgi:choice-of-anchor C domain-containing protein
MADFLYLKTKSRLRRNFGGAKGGEKMNINKILVGAAAGVLILGGTATAVFAVGSNGSFETGTNPGPSFTTLYFGDNSIDGWTVDSGSVDYIGPLWEASEGVRSIDLNGFTAGSISQVLTTVSGATYNVTFDLSGNPGSRSQGDPYWSPSIKEVLVGATGASSQSFYYDTDAMDNSYPSPMYWVGYTYSFVATSTSTTLTFASQILGAFGPALDNVVIGEILPTPTPTPVSLPTNKDQCKKGGWEFFGVFKNQGDCVSFVATGGKNLPANL